MKPQIRILETTGNKLKLDFVWRKEDNSFELPAKSKTETPDTFHYFWYFSNGKYFLDPEAQPVFENTNNQVFESGLLLYKKKKKGPIVRGKASPTPKPPVYDKATLYIHVEASGEEDLEGVRNFIPIEQPLSKEISPEGNLPPEAASNKTSLDITPGTNNDGSAPKINIEPIQLEAVILGNVVIAVLKYTRSEALDADGYLRISMNRRSTEHPPLMVQQKPIFFNNEWVDLAAPADEYLQAIQIGFEDMEIGETRALFIPCWALYREDPITRDAVINLENELKVEWLKIDKTGEEEELVILEEHMVLLETEAQPVSQ